jgi:hypothetical protein
MPLNPMSSCTYDVVYTAPMTDGGTGSYDGTTVVSDSATPHNTGSTTFSGTFP